MKRFFSPNIGTRGRIVRGALGGLLVTGGLVVCAYHTWVAVVMILSGGFCLLEAARGWCVMRACGVKTKL